MLKITSSGMWNQQVGNWLGAFDTRIDFLGTNIFVVTFQLLTKFSRVLDGDEQISPLVALLPCEIRFSKI